VHGVPGGQEFGALADLVDSMAVGVANVGRDGTIVGSNREFVELVGRANVVGSSFYEFFDRDRERIQTACARLWAGGGRGARSIETSLVLPDGRRRPVELRGSLIRHGDDGSPSGVALCVIDQSGRSGGEAESARLRAVFEEISELLGLMAPDGTVISMNTSALEFFGGPAGEKGLFQFVPSDSSGLLVGNVLPALAATGRWEGEVDLLRHDGEKVAHHVTLQRHHDAGSGDDYYWAIARDRSTARKAAEAENLASLNSAKDRFIAVVSHELRTPLTAVRGFADVLADAGPGHADRWEYVEVIQREAYAMSVIVEDLLVASRIESGRIQVVIEPMDVTEAVGAVIAGLVPSQVGRVENRVEPGVLALGDAMRCRQVVRNLVVNALRHGGARTWVEASSEPGGILLRVCDDGAGVDAALRETLFDPYVARPNDGKRPESIGLGLSVSRQLARLMGGDLAYSYDGHSTFTLSLPAISDARS
jgi:PAS domain S-box-containing protein